MYLFTLRSNKQACIVASLFISALASPSRQAQKAAGAAALGQITISNWSVVLMKPFQMTAGSPLMQCIAAPSHLGAPENPWPYAIVPLSRCHKEKQTSVACMAAWNK